MYCRENLGTFFDSGAGAIAGYLSFCDLLAGLKNRGKSVQKYGAE
jgi:hypothetical protein